MDEYIKDIVGHTNKLILDHYRTGILFEVFRKLNHDEDKVSMYLFLKNRIKEYTPGNTDFLFNDEFEYTFVFVNDSYYVDKYDKFIIKYKTEINSFDSCLRTNELFGILIANFILSVIASISNSQIKFDIPDEIPYFTQRALLDHGFMTSSEYENRPYIDFESDNLTKFINVQQDKKQIKLSDIISSINEDTLIDKRNDMIDRMKSLLASHIQSESQKEVPNFDMDEVDEMNAIVKSEETVKFDDLKNLTESLNTNDREKLFDQCSSVINTFSDLLSKKQAKEMNDLLDCVD